MIGLATFLLIVGGALVWSRELRDTLLYTIAPRHARDSNFVRLTRGPRTVHILGTIHGRHLSTSQYSLAHLKAVIAHLRPDVLLVEARPQELARGRWGDGPIEMPYAGLTGRARGLRVAGIDWWDANARPGMRRTDDVRDDKIFRNMMDRLPERGAALVLVGYSHVPELTARLIAAGFAVRPITAEQKSRLFGLLDEPFRYPPGMTAAITGRIEDAKATARSSPHLADTMRAVIDARERYLEEIRRVGEYRRSSRPASAIPAPPPGDIGSIASLRTVFLSRARRCGLSLDFTPEVREWTRPSLISWRQEARAVAIPRWEELSSSQRTLLVTMAGDGPQARRLFGWLFRWFFVPHELTHAFQTNLSCSAADHATSERLANDVAVAFFAEQPHGLARLAQLETVLRRVVHALPPLPAEGSDRYFNEHYDELAADPARYGAFQLRFILDSLVRARHMSFDDVAARIRPPAPKQHLRR